MRFPSASSGPGRMLVSAPPLTSPYARQTLVILRHSTTMPSPIPDGWRHWRGDGVRCADRHVRVAYPPRRRRAAGFGGYDDLLDGSSRQRGHREPAARFSQSEDVLLPSACAALYRRGMLEDIGLFDEDFFLYCEDTDLGLRARWAGWRCRYVAGAGVKHRYSHSAGAYSPLKARFVERNRLWVAIKNFPAAMLIGAPMVWLLRCLWQLAAVRSERGAAAEFVRSGQSLRVAGTILARAHWDTLLHLPALLRKRAELRGKRRLRAAEFTRLMRRHRITAKDLAHA